jgi:steroid 5-alpha reductase family enzyme
MIVAYGWAVVAVGMALLWWRQTRTRNATSVDAAWAAALGLLALAYAWLTPGEPARRVLVAGVAGVWAFRLAYHLVRYRVLRESEEDGRYRAMREYWGARAQPWFFVVYQLQAAVAALFSIFFLLAMRRPGPLDAWDFAGLAVALIALGGEAMADRQLATWRAAHPGKTCRAGLWRYSRHPNYFFEWIHWWAYVLIGVGNWYLLLGPALMLLFLFRVTGIPYTERQALKSRGDDYRRYQRTTSVFFPWLPEQETR